MKAPSSLQTLALALASSLTFSITANAGTTSNCDKVAANVRAEVEKDPAKVLVIVEDSMVANESCACEIVKAAILASKASGDMVKQIVLTATNVAPHMSKTIVECASAIAPGEAGNIQASAAGAMSDKGKGFSDPSTTEGSGGDYRAPAGGVQGVYLVQPSAGGVTPKTTDTPTKQVIIKRVVVKRTPPDTSVPQSPANADCACPAY